MAMSAFQEAWTSRSPASGYPTLPRRGDDLPTRLRVCTLAVWLCCLLLDFFGLLPLFRSWTRRCSILLIVCIYVPLCVHGLLSSTITIPWLVVQAGGHCLLLAKQWDDRIRPSPPPTGPIFFPLHSTSAPITAGCCPISGPSALRC